METNTASGSTSAKGQTLKKAELLVARINNRVWKRVFHYSPGKAKSYKIHVYCDNDDGQLNKWSYPVCIYNGVWHKLALNNKSGKPTIVEPVPEIHDYDSERASSDHTVEDTSEDEEAKKESLAI